jgi:hypothetical protein
VRQALGSRRGRFGAIGADREPVRFKAGIQLTDEHGTRGGARPGAGRKSTKTVGYQTTRRALIEQVVTVKRWCAIIEMAVTQAESGDRYAREWLASYVVGPPPKEIVLKGDEDHPFKLKTYQVVSPDDWPDP